VPARHNGSRHRRSAGPTSPVAAGFALRNALAQQNARLPNGSGQADLTMPHPPTCKVCGHPVVAAKSHEIPAAKAAKMFRTFKCECGKAARVRCFNGLGTYWIECDDGHGKGGPA
jgi:hypothetical protein